MNGPIFLKHTYIYIYTVKDIFISYICTIFIYAIICVERIMVFIFFLTKHNNEMKSLISLNIITKHNNEMISLI